MVVWDVLVRPVLVRVGGELSLSSVGVEGDSDLRFARGAGVVGERCKRGIGSLAGSIIIVNQWHDHKLLGTYERTVKLQRRQKRREQFPLPDGPLQ